MVNFADGLVLTKIRSVSPAWILVCEQYPSIHGHRYRVFGSTRVRVSNQSVVPGFLFSAPMRSHRGVLVVDVPTHPLNGASDAASPAPTTPLSRSRRLMESLDLFLPAMRRGEVVIEKDLFLQILVGVESLRRNFRGFAGLVGNRERHRQGEWTQRRATARVLTVTTKLPACDEVKARQPDIFHFGEAQQLDVVGAVAARRRRFRIANETELS